MHQIKQNTRLSNTAVLLTAGVVIAGILLLLSLAAADALLEGWRLNYEVLHAVIETLGCMMALGIAAFLVMRQNREENAYMMPLACSVLIMGILDAFHACLSPSPEFFALRTFAQFSGALILILLWLPPRFIPQRIFDTLPRIVTAAAGLFAIVSLIFPEILPVMQTRTGPTELAQTFNFAAGILFLAAVGFFVCRARIDSTNASFLFAVFALMFAITGMASAFSEPFGASWWLLHMLRLTAYAAGFRYVALSSTFEFVRLATSEHTIKKLAALVASSHDAIIGQTLDGTINTWNAGASNTFGYEPGEVEGASISILVPLTRAAELCELTERVKNGENIEQFETLRRTKDDRTIDVSLTMSPIVDPDGNLEGISTIARDITARKKAEEAICAAREQAEKSNRELEKLNEQLQETARQANVTAREAMEASETKGRFLANMSHEIRTPMNAIIGLSEVLCEEEDLACDHRNHVELIHSSSKDLLQLINDILDFSKIEAGKLDIERIDCSLKQMVESIETLMRPAAAKKSLNFEISTAEDLPASVHTDPGRVRQCLINLVGNAIKFTETGCIRINVSKRITDDQPYIVFEVEDTGIGIPPERQKIIFDAFSQAESDTARKYGGTGLGLAVTKQLTELLGGGLSLTSTVGAGSTFTMTIPAGSCATNTTIEQHDSPSQTAPDELPSLEHTNFNGNVLVAEDSKTNQMLIRLLLEKIGLDVCIVENGDQAVETARSKEFDLIFMDMFMPELDGYEATTILRDAGLKTPIIALTADAMTGAERKCLDAGCDAYLTKPIDRAKLLQIARKYLQPDSDRDASKLQPVAREDNYSESDR